ncbi:MAG: DUF5320 domain-containing protein [Desulfobulbus sp.]|nr:DUF5320 domain-containing protein [Desulfobulbus sp.]
MPRLDGTGPAGEGRLTGRGLGPCGGSDAQYTGIPMRGLGFGRGMRMGRGYGCGTGYGRGFGQGYGPGFGVWTGTETDAEGMKQILMDRRNTLKAQLEAIDKRLETL